LYFIFKFLDVCYICGLGRLGFLFSRAIAVTAPSVAYVYGCTMRCGIHTRPVSSQ